MKQTKYFVKRETSCGCEYEELWADGELVLSGDHYHDKICFKVQGYFQALNDNNMPYEVTSESMLCPHGCED